jgi:hypothetical protein
VLIKVQIRMRILFGTGLQASQSFFHAPRLCDAGFTGIQNASYGDHPDFKGKPGSLGNE